MQILQTKKIHGLIETNSPTPMMDDTRQRIYVLLAASHGRRLVENSAKQKLVLCAYTAHSTTESIRERLDELSYRYQIEKIFFLPSPITHRGAMKQGQYRFFPQNVGIVVHTLINMILNIQQFGPVVVMDSPPRGGGNHRPTLEPWDRYWSQPWIERYYHMLGLIKAFCPDITMVLWPDILQHILSSRVDSETGPTEIERLSYELMPDKIHLNRYGYQKWSNFILDHNE